MIDDVSQLVVLDGVAVEEMMRRSGSNMFLFLDDDGIGLERVYYRWRVYSYLMGDGNRKYNG